jgi:HK97 family phage major capsid protein
MSIEQDEIFKAINEVKHIVNDRTKDIVTDEKFDKVVKDLIGLQERLQKSEQEALALKVALQTAGFKEDKTGLSDNEKKHQEILEHYIRKGDNDIEFKTLAVYAGQDGGYTVPKAMSAKIIQRVYETSPIRSIASVVSIGTDSIEYIMDTGDFSQGWVSEAGDRPSTATSNFSKKTIAVHEQYAEPQATQKMLDDSEFNIEGWIASKVSDKFARMENTALVIGAGINSPRGLLTYAHSSSYDVNSIEQINLGSSSVLTSNGLIDLQNSLLEPYQGNAKWLMSRSSYGSLLKLIRSDNKFNEFLGLPNASGVATLLGKPIVIASDMPTIASNSLSLAYGDFSQAYEIVDRTGIRLIRDQFTAKPSIKFYFTKRVGGDVVNTQAIKIGKIAA